MQSTKELLIIKQGNIRVNNYICSCALLFDNVHLLYHSSGDSFNKQLGETKSGLLRVRRQ